MRVAAGDADGGRNRMACLSVVGSRSKAGWKGRGLTYRLLDAYATPMTPHLRLGVNIDHVATIRNARGGRHPDPVRAARARGGGRRRRHHRAPARGSPPHLRRRHRRACAAERGRAAQPGNGGDRRDAADRAAASAARRLSRPGTARGADHRGRAGRCRAAPPTSGLSSTGSGAAGIRVTLFVEPAIAQVEAAAALGAHAVELHTGA